MNDIFVAAGDLQYFCEQQGWSFCFIGGIAVQRWGQPRLTRDVDITLLSGFGNEELFIDPLLSHYTARIPDAHEFALMSRVLLLETEKKIPLDIALGAMPFEERTIKRASAFQLSNTITITTCSAEDLIVHKAFANRAQDWLDIEGIIIRQGRHLRHRIILQEVAPLAALKDEPALLEQLRLLLSRH